MGTNQCFNCGKEGHFSRNCPMGRQGQGGQNQQQRQQRPQLHAAQASIEGPRINQGRLEAPQHPDAHVHAFTKADVEAGPFTVVTGQILVTTYYANVLFDSGASHSFISRKFANGLNYAQDRISQAFLTALPSGEMLSSNSWLRHVPIRVAERELHVDLIVLEMANYDVILGMDFLGKYRAIIDCGA